MGGHFSDAERVERMREAVLHDELFIHNPWPVPEKLRGIVRAVDAAICVAQMAAQMDDPNRPEVLHWKRAAVEEIDHQAGLLADPDYVRAVTA